MSKTKFCVNWAELLQLRPTLSCKGVPVVKKRANSRLQVEVGRYLNRLLFV